MGSSQSKASHGAATTVRRFPKVVSGQKPKRMEGATTSRASRGFHKDDGEFRSRHYIPLSKGSRKVLMRTTTVIVADGADPDFTPGDFSKRLHDMGIAQPKPTYSPSSIASRVTRHQATNSQTQGAKKGENNTNNTILSVLEARQRIQQTATEELHAEGVAADQLKRFVTMKDLTTAIRLRNQGTTPEAIESRLRLQKGTIERLGNSYVPHNP